MLVLSRKEHEEIKIGDDITVSVLEIRGDKVRIGVTAPPDVLVDRKEIRTRKEKEKQNEDVENLPTDG